MDGAQTQNELLMPSHWIQINDDCSTHIELFRKVQNNQIRKYHQMSNIIIQNVKHTKYIHTVVSRDPCGLLAIFGLKAFGLRWRVVSTASFLSFSFSTLFRQFKQLQPLQWIPAAKHSQYLKGPGSCLLIMKRKILGKIMIHYKIKIAHLIT